MKKAEKLTDMLFKSREKLCRILIAENVLNDRNLTDRIDEASISVTAKCMLILKLSGFSCDDISVILAASKAGTAVILEDLAGKYPDLLKSS